jgi:glutathione S-transferase
MIELFELAGADEAVRFSPYCWRIRMSLAHKGLDAEMVPWHFQQRDTLPAGTSTVPVLVDDEDVISDSWAIAQHLEAAYPNAPSLFGGETGEAHARFVAAWADKVLHPALLPLVAPELLTQVRPEAAAYFRETRERRLGVSLEEAAAQRETRLGEARAVLAPVREVVGSQPFLGGEEPTYADYAVFGGFQWARLVSQHEVLAAEDPVHGWRERMLDLFDGLARSAPTA